MKSLNNPFASRHMESLSYLFTDLSLTAVMERLASQNFRGAITGPRGSGKTTLLETIGRRLEQTGFKCRYLYLKRENKSRGITRCPYPAGENCSRMAFLIDGAEQLSRFGRYRLYLKIKPAGAVVITTHGRSALPGLIRTRTSPALLYDLVFQLTGKTDMLSEQAIFALYHRHQGDIRQALRELYDVWAAGRGRSDLHPVNMSLDISHVSH